MISSEALVASAIPHVVSEVRYFQIVLSVEYIRGNGAIAAGAVRSTAAGFQIDHDDYALAPQ